MALSIRPLADLRRRAGSRPARSRRRREVRGPARRVPRSSASITRVGGRASSASRSSRWSRCRRRLIAHHGALGVQPWSVRRSALRAAARRLAATPSSRSRITTSAAAAAAFANRSGRSAGQNSQPGPGQRQPVTAFPLLSGRFRTSGLRTAVATTSPCWLRPVCARVTMPSPGRLFDSRLSVHLCLGVQRVAVESGLGNATSEKPRLRDDRALRQLRHRQPDQRRQREHRVHQPLVERRQRGGRRRRGAAPGCSSSAW